MSTTWDYEKKSTHWRYNGSKFVHIEIIKFLGRATRYSVQPEHSALRAPSRQPQFVPQSTKENTRGEDEGVGSGMRRELWRTVENIRQIRALCPAGSVLTARRGAPPPAETLRKRLGTGGGRREGGMLRERENIRHNSSTLPCGLRPDSPHLCTASRRDTEETLGDWWRA